MIINVVGTNFAGKTTLIEKSLSTHPSAFLDIRQYRDIIAPAFYAQHFDRVGPPSLQWALARRRVDVVKIVMGLAFSGQPKLASRFWRYFFVHDGLVAAAPRLAPGQKRWIVDEGLPKKFIEAVPFVAGAAADRARKKWRTVMERHAGDIVTAVQGLADGFIFVDAEPDDIVVRSRQRWPALIGTVGEEAIRGRHAIQREAFRRLMDAAAHAGLKTATINTSQPDAQDRFNAEINRF